MSTPHDPTSPDDRYLDGPPYPPPPPGWTYPAPPPGTGLDGLEDARQGGRPGGVVAAVVCWLLSGLVLIGSGALTVAGSAAPEARRELANMFAESEVQLTDQALRQLLIGTGLVSIAFGLITVVFGLLLLGGSNWVRILLTVVGLLDVLLVLFGVLFVIAAVVLQFLPSSNQWFRARAARRAT